MQHQDDIQKNNDLKPNLAKDIIANKPLRYQDESSIHNSNTNQRDTDLIENGRTTSSSMQQLRVDGNSIPVNFYHVLKKIDETVEKSSRKAIESSFRFPGKGKHGHKVKGKLPVLIKPFKNIDINYDNINKIEITRRLIFVIQNIVNTVCIKKTKTPRKLLLIQI